MPSPAYSFFLNKLHVNSKTSPGDYVDKDVVVFAVTWNGQIFPAPASNPAVGPTGGSQPAGVNDPFYVDGYIGLATSGNDIVLCVLPSWPPVQNYQVPPGTDLTKSWAIGPINITGDDIITVFYSVTNLSYFKGNPTAAYLKIVGAQLAALAALEAIGGASEPPPADVGVLILSGLTAVLGGVIALVGEILGDLFPGQPNCNGPVVLSPALSFTGSQLQQTANTPVPAPNVSQYTTTIVNAGLSSIASSDCYTPSTDVTWSILRDMSPLDVFGPTPAPLKMSTRGLAISTGPRDWSGMWGDGQYMNNSLITVVIVSSGDGISGSSYQERISSYTSGLVHTMNQESATVMLLGQDPRAKRASALSVVATPMMIHAISPGPGAAMPVSARYFADITEHIDSSNGPVAESISVRNLVEIPMLALTLPQRDIYPPLIPLKFVAAPALGGKSSGSPQATTRLASAPPIAPGGPVRMAVPITYVATLLASANVSLHLYGLFDPNGEIVGHKIRYLRTNDSGEVITDVMLVPVQYLPT